MEEENGRGCSGVASYAFVTLALALGFAVPAVSKIGKKRVNTNIKLRKDLVKSSYKDIF